MEELKKLVEIITFTVLVVAGYPDQKKDLEMNFDVALDNN